VTREYATQESKQVSRNHGNQVATVLGRNFLHASRWIHRPLECSRRWLIQRAYAASADAPSSAATNGKISQYSRTPRGRPPLARAETRVGKGEGMPSHTLGGPTERVGGFCRYLFPLVAANLPWPRGSRQRHGQRSPHLACGRCRLRGCAFCFRLCRRFVFHLFEAVDECGLHYLRTDFLS
jgi:hypothetical protein